MNRILLLSVTFLMTYMVNGQVEAPQLSPRANVEQTVGLTNFELDYSRPSVRDRKVFGELLPYGEMWRTGANKNTMLTFDTDIKFGGNDVKAGTYAIFVKINKDSWDIYLYSDTENWGTPEKWEEEKVVSKVTVPVKASATVVETFTISFNDLGTESFNLVFSWSKIMLQIPVELPTKELTEASIIKTMNGPSDRDYYGAATYYLASGEKLEEALEYIKKAVDMKGDDAYWYLRKQALIEFELGQVKAAIQTAEKSLASAEKAGNAGYVKMNEKSIEEWSK
jgi:hypothetical protein